MTHDPPKSFPECLLQSPNHSSDLNQWVRPHNQAVIAWHKASVGAIAPDLRPSERGILSLLDGLDTLADSIARDTDPWTVEHVWDDLLAGASNLLNLDIGRLQGGPLSDFLSTISVRVGRHPDTGEYVGQA